MVFSRGTVLVCSKFTSNGTDVARRELLIESQRVSFHAPATDERGMVRHYTLSADDMALINRRRGNPNRMGLAVLLCYLRFPGRILKQGEQPPEVLCAFVAEQLGLDVAHFGDYAELDQTRRDHVNLTGDYHWETASTLGPDQFRLLRTRLQSRGAAA
jgi:TnpA family transposase